MAKTNKRYKAIAEKVNADHFYPLNEAFSLVKETASAKFDEGVDVAINLGVEARKSDQAVRGSTVLPNGTGKSVRVAVFTQAIGGLMYQASVGGQKFKFFPPGEMK